MGVFVEESNDKSFRRTVHDAGLGAFAGGLGIGERTELVYSGLLYYGDFDAKKMKKAWNEASIKRGDREPLPANWTKKIFMVEKGTYIIGDHRANTWTSFINSHNSSQLTHASIVGLKGLIVFHETVDGFDEVFLNYGVHISMTEHQPMNSKKASDSEGDSDDEDGGDEEKSRGHKRLKGGNAYLQTSKKQQNLKLQTLSTSLPKEVHDSKSNEVKGLVKDLSRTNYVPKTNYRFFKPEESANLRKQFSKSRATHGPSNKPAEVAGTKRVNTPAGQAEAAGTKGDVDGPPAKMFKDKRCRRSH